MNWIDVLLDRGYEAKRTESPQPPDRYRPIARPTTRATVASSTVELPAVPTEIKVVSVTVRPPSDDGDPGSCERGYYSVADGLLTMCSEDGKPIKSVRLGPGDEPRLVAARLTRGAYLTRAGDGDFNRKITYQRSGVA